MNQRPTIIDMTIEGDFVAPPPDEKPPFSARIMLWAAAIAGLAISCAVAVFALWLLAFLIPLVVIAALIAYAAFRFQLWRSGGSVQSFTFQWPPRR